MPELTREELRAIHEDLEKSNAARGRLTLVTIIVGVIALALWATVVVAIFMVQHARGETERNGRIGVENLQQACFNYYQRTDGNISPICKDSEFVSTDGTMTK